MLSTKKCFHPASAFILNLFEYFILVLAPGGSIQFNEHCPNIVEALRQVCGTPHDPEVCRVLYPESLRAKYGGLTPEENAVHCSDLEEDGVLEVEYFFSLIQLYT